jgi:hypothetical protein
MATYIEGTVVLYTEEQRSSVHTQLERLLENSHFSHSKRFPSFLRFIVQEELEGRGEQLKERTLGLEVFGREPGYDTTADPIVRVTAAEIRKRIAQYYQEPGHSGELRISLPPGSYIPHFDWPSPQLADSHPPPLLPNLHVSHEPGGSNVLDTLPMHADGPTPKRRVGRWLAWIALAVAAALVSLMVVWLWNRSRVSAFDAFWSPVLTSGESVVVCFPRNQLDVISLRDAASPEAIHHFQEPANALVLDDLLPLVSITGLLQVKNQPYVLMGQDSATLTDLRHGPTIFLGAFDNSWTLRVTRGLRFRFGNDAGMKHFWIEDTQSPARWEVDRGQQMATNNYRDYAIVARFLDANTGQVAIVSAGIARGGTVAAGEFLTQPANIELIKAHAPKNWRGQNMEFVLGTEIIDGRSAPPRIEATYFW